LSWVRRKLRNEIIVKHSFKTTVLNIEIYLKSKEELDFMKPPTMKELNRIGELVSKKFPTTTFVDWEYKIGKKAHFLNFRIRDEKNVPKKEREEIINNLKNYKSFKSLFDIQKR
jgi:hypothetical protein